jgi:hypothetical protein
VANLSGSEQAVIVERGHEHDARWQDITHARATNHMRRWSEWEDELILAPNAAPEYEQALELRRSLIAVRDRRRNLKLKRMGKP